MKLFNINNKNLHYGNGDYELSIKNEENFDYIIGLIRQSYDKQMS